MSNQVESKQEPTSGPPVRLMKIEEIGAWLGCSRSQIYRLLHAGQLPKPIWLKSSRRWLEPDVRAWMQAGCPSTEQWEKVKKG